MTLLSIYAAVLLSSSIVIGLRYATSSIWKGIDLLYYPLGAIGVVLLFSSTNTQRRLVDLAQAQDAIRSEISLMENRRPLSHRMLEFSRFEDGVRQLGEVFSEDLPQCRSDKNSPACLVQRRVSLVVLPFVAAHATQKAQEPEYRHRETCGKVSLLFRDLQSQALSPLVARELEAFYTEQSNRNLEFGDALKLPGAFAERVRDRAEKLPQGGQRREIALRARAEASLMWRVWFGVFECWKKYEGTTWALKRDELAQRHDEIESRMREIRESVRDESPFMSFMRLFVWPYVIILALALKLAKAVAGIRPAARLDTKAAAVSLPFAESLPRGRALRFRGTRLPIRPKRRCDAP